jgi:hypothetical protein
VATARFPARSGCLEVVSAGAADNRSRGSNNKAALRVAEGGSLLIGFSTP